MPNQFAQSTQKLLDKLPSWFKMRKDPESTGAQFLNVIGLSLDEVEHILDYALQQYYINTTDINVIDIVYKAKLPEVLTDYVTVFYSNEIQLQPVATLLQFFTGLKTDKIKIDEIYYDNPYIIDNELKTLYVRKPYGGQIQMIVTNKAGKKILITDLELSLHHIWNFFDEFGLMLGVSRLYGEINVDYKERILDVFRRPSSGAKEGLINGIARELGLVIKHTWVNGAVDFVIQEQQVLKDTIKVDNESIDSSTILYNRNGFMFLSSALEYKNISRDVSYIVGIEINELHDKSNTKFQNELFTIDKMATPVLQYYINTIVNRVPVTWDRFIWNESFWNIADADINGYGYIPVYFDADIKGWRNFKI